MITKITNIQVFNTALKDFELLDVYVKNDKFYHLGYDKTIVVDKVIEGSNKYLIPGLIDSHMHIESSMTTPQQFSNTALPLGTTTILADAHEVANVFGLDGLKEYMNQKTHMDIFYAIPSSVPSTNSKLETTGGKIDENDISELVKDPKIIALGEIMNFKAVVSDDDNMVKQIVKNFQTALPNAPIEGHIPNVSGLELSKYVQLGIGSDHTQQTSDTLLERVRNNLLVQLQEKSLNKEIVDTINKYQLFNNIALVTDDVLPNDLIKKGHLNHIIKKITSFGMDIKDAIYCATYTPALRMRLYDRGVIAPNKLADFIILDDLNIFKINSVYKNGVNIKDLEKQTAFKCDKKAFNSIIRDKVRKSDFIVKSDKDFEDVRVMYRLDNSTYTEERFVKVAVKDNILQWQAAGLSLISVIERYGNNSEIKFGFVENGFNQPCATATSWTHDHHNILVMGTNIDDMVDCVNYIIEEQGGIIFKSKEKQHSIKLPYGGIVSLDPIEKTAKKIEDISLAMKEYGYKSHNELMSFSVLSLLVSPALKISDKGYVRVQTQEILSWNK